MGLLAASLFAAEFASAQQTPSKPQFTLTYTVQSHVIPERTPVYTVDPYTGQQETKVPGERSYTQEVRVVEIKIKNQLFTPYTNSENRASNFYYNVSYKGYYETEWKGYYNPDSPGGGFLQSSSDYTVIYFANLPNDGGRIDFRIQAQIGYYDYYFMPMRAYSFYGQASGWSSTQTIDVPAVLPTPVPTSAVTPTATVPPSTTLTPTATSPSSYLPESITDWLQVGAVAALGFLVVLLFVLVVLLLRRVRVLEAKVNGN